MAPERRFEEEDDVSAVFRTARPEIEVTDFRTRAQNARRAWPPESGDEKLEPLYPTVLHALAAAAKLGEKLGATLLHEDGHEELRSYRFLYTEARRLAAALAERGVRQGDRILLLHPTSFDFLLGMFAAQFAGAIPVPVPPGLSKELDDAVEPLGASVLLHSAETADEARALQGRHRAVRQRFALDALVAADPNPKAKAGSRDLAFLQLSPGSAGRSRAVAITHRNLVSAVHAVGVAARFSREDVLVCRESLSHSAGLVGGLLSAVYWRLPLVLVGPKAARQEPSLWLQAISRHRGTVTFATNGSWAEAARKLTAAEKERLELSSLRLALSGGERVKPETRDEVSRAFAACGLRKEAFQGAWALSEVTSCGTFGGARALSVSREALARGEVVPEEGGLSLLSSGVAVPGHRVLIVGPDGAPLPERRLGEIVVSGPAVMRGYFRDPERTDAALREGLLHTGDLGFLDGGELFAVGRANELVQADGKLLLSDELERAACEVEGVAAAAVFGVDGALALAVEAAEDAGRAESLRKALAATGAKVGELAFVAAGALPRTLGGRIARGRVRTLLAEGKLAPAPSGGLFARLKRTFARG